MPLLAVQPADGPMRAPLRAGAIFRPRSSACARPTSTWSTSRCYGRRSPRCCRHARSRRAGEISLDHPRYRAELARRPRASQRSGPRRLGARGIVKMPRAPRGAIPGTAAPPPILINPPVAPPGAIRSPQIRVATEASSMAPRACTTVEWSRPPSSLPIAPSGASVWRRQRIHGDVTWQRDACRAPAGRELRPAHLIVTAHLPDDATERLAARRSARRYGASASRTSASVIGFLASCPNASMRRRTPSIWRPCCTSAPPDGS